LRNESSFQRTEHFLEFIPEDQAGKWSEEIPANVAEGTSEKQVEC
jgi:hypothetical protein